MAETSFYFDLGSPYAWLSAERIDGAFEAAGLPAPEWKPVLLGGLFKRFDRGSWALTDERAKGMAEIERRAAEYGLPPLEWPDPWPGMYLVSMRAATAAAAEGRTKEFALACFRRSFTEGLDPANRGTLELAASDVGLDTDELFISASSVDIKSSLKATTEMAGNRGVIGVPTVAIGDRNFFGDDQLDDAIEFAVSQ